MPFSFAVWYRNLFRPRVTHVRVIVYEKGEVKDISTYPSFRLRELVQKIDELWAISPRGKQSYWFETEVYEHAYCFQKRQATIQVTCYTENNTNPNLKKQTDIPIRYRQKFFDKKHVIIPITSAGLPWPQKVEVKFTNA